MKPPGREKLVLAPRGYEAASVCGMLHCLLRVLVTDRTYSARELQRL